MKHTPTPWQVNDQRKSGWMDNSIYITGNHNLAKLYDDYKQAEANAAHIVKCVNLHDELVTALEKIALDLDGKIQAADIEDLSFALNTAKDAIAKARVEA